MTIALQLLADLLAHGGCIRSNRQQLEEPRCLLVSLAGESIETGIIALVAVSRHLLAGFGCIIRRQIAIHIGKQLRCLLFSLLSLSGISNQFLRLGCYLGCIQMIGAGGIAREIGILIFVETVLVEGKLVEAEIIGTRLLLQVTAHDAETIRGNLAEGCAIQVELVAGIVPVGIQREILGLVAERAVESHRFRRRVGDG